MSTEDELEQAQLEEDLKKSKKKSSKKKKEDVNEDGEEAVPKKKKKDKDAATEDGESTKKKKKKDKDATAAPEDEAAEPATQAFVEDAADDLDAMLQDLGLTKKKKKKSSSSSAAKEASTRPESDPQADREQYSKLLGRVYESLRTNNPDLVEKKKALLRPPTVQRIGTSRIMWTNFAEICKTMKRDQTHVSNYFLTELGTTGSMTAQEQFLLKGKFVPKYIESLLKKYIHEYVTCNMCHGVDTRLHRETAIRMTMLKCDSCGASRAVATIQKGYVAATRATRKAARNATG